MPSQADLREKLIAAALRLLEAEEGEPSLRAVARTAGVSAMAPYWHFADKAGLMAELEKIVRVLKKLDPEAPHDSVLVLDATTGQNGLRQAEVFKEATGLTGVILTKLDGTAKGSVGQSSKQRYTGVAFTSSLSLLGWEASRW